MLINIYFIYTVINLSIYSSPKCNHPRRTFVFLHKLLRNVGISSDISHVLSLMLTVKISHRTSEILEK